MSLDQAWIKLNGLITISNAVLVLTQIEETECSIGVKVGIIWIDLNGSSVAIDSP